MIGGNYEIFITSFAKKSHFDDLDSAGTKITNKNPYVYEEEIYDKFMKPYQPVLYSGYAPFCKHAFVENHIDVLSGVIEITSKNKHYLITNYHARRDGELPVLSRYFDRSVINAPKAKWLDIVLYSAEQIEKENKVAEEKGFEVEEIRGDYGIVAILGVMTAKESPMTPATMIRNVSIDEGGSGVELDRDAYMESVEYWSKWALVG